MTQYTIADGPLVGHYSSSTTAPVFTGQRESFPVGLELTGTGREYVDRAGARWIQAKTPWMVSTGRGVGLWFHSGYLSPKTAKTVAKPQSVGDVRLAAWIAATEGRQIDVDGKWGAQCVDLSKDWAISQWGLRPGAYGDGVDVAAGIASSGQGWTFHAPSATPQPGWIGSWGKPYGVWREKDKNGKLTGRVEFYGHTAVVIGAPVDGRVPVLQQDGFDEHTVATRAWLPLDSVVGWAAPPAVPGSVATSAAATHLVRKGETLWGISRQHGMSVADIQRLNPSADADNLPVGATLIVSKGV